MTLQPTRPAPAAADTELLFKEAHQRRRRRRLGIAAITLVAVAVSTAAVALTRSSHAQPAPAAPVAQQPAVKLPGTAPRIAWVDYQGNVRIGSLQTHEQRIIARGARDPVTSIVASGSRLFWVSGSFTKLGGPTVMVYDTATGRVGRFASGDRVFNAAGSTDVFVDAGDPDSYLSLVRYSLQGRLVQRFSYPQGWYLPDPETLGTSTLALARGEILLQTESARLVGKPVSAEPSKLAVWTPATGNLRVIGDASFLVATYTDRSNAGSSVAWLPWSCGTTYQTCAVQLTDLGSGTTRQIRSPLGFGFDMRGAFSPDGTQLAAFANTSSGGYNPETRRNPETRLALIDVATGSLRLVPAATIEIGEGIGWAQWLPGSRQLIAGGVEGADAAGIWKTNHFLVDSVTRSAAPFSFLRDGQQDVNYSAVVLP
jgi:hypothetical protein